MAYKDEVYTILLKAKRDIIEYTNKKVSNPEWTPFYNGIAENLDDILVDYAIATKMSGKELITCYENLGAKKKDNVLHGTYESIKMEM